MHEGVRNPCQRPSRAHSNSVIPKKKKKRAFSLIEPFYSFLPNRYHSPIVSHLKTTITAAVSTQSTRLLHGFPEIWYSWRYQMIAVAKAGYRAIAPDYRGYGLSDPPPEPQKASFADFIKDIVDILDALNIPKVFLVGKYFGAPLAYFIALFHQRRVSAVATLGLPFLAAGGPLSHNLLPEGFYVSRWKEPGRAEADFGRFDARTVVRNIYILFSKTEIPIANENQEIMDLVEPSTPLPSWITEEEFATSYEDLYEKSGFQTALQVPYRWATVDKSSLENPKIELPALLIMGENDYCIKIPGMEDYIRSGQVKVYVPNLEIKYMPEGSHFVQEQLPDEVNQLLLGFLSSQAQS